MTENVSQKLGKKPLFSVIIPTYNQVNLLGATVNSVLFQSFCDYEIIVVDDGSTDNTLEMLKTYGDKIRIICQENRGAEAARHNGSIHAQGEYFVLLDHDDLLLGDALAVYNKVIRLTEKPALIIARICRFHDHDFEPMPQYSISSDGIKILQYSNYFRRDRALAETCSQIVIRRDVAETTCALRANLTAFPFDSCDILLSVGSKGPCIAIQHPVTVAYRYHDNNSSADLEYMVKMGHRLLNLSRYNSYLIKKHRFSRYAKLGGIQFSYIKKSLRAGRKDLALHVIKDSWQMIFVAIIRKILLKFRRKVAPIILQLIFILDICVLI